MTAGERGWGAGTAPETVTRFRPVGQAEPDRLAAGGFPAFPPGVPDQPIFSPVRTAASAVQIAYDRNTKDASGYAGSVTRVRVAFRAPYPVRSVGASAHQEYWIPAEDLAALNTQLVGPIEVVGEFRGRASGPA